MTVYYVSSHHSNQEGGPEHITVSRRRLAIGSTGPISGGLTADLALLFVFVVTFIFFAFPMCQSDHLRLWRSLINRS